MQIMYYPESKVWCWISHALLEICLFERQRPNNANEGLYQMWTWSKKRSKQVRHRRNQGVVQLCVTLLIKHKKNLTMFIRFHVHPLNIMFYFIANISSQLFMKQHSFNVTLQTYIMKLILKTIKNITVFRICYSLHWWLHIIIKCI